ncbi:MAG TPA: DASS family sodium-coupled anion symporter [Pirellulales bacterium]|nr:DASS family sodium-coupled anion symporter [Pirellulales bacterium]
MNTSSSDPGPEACSLEPEASSPLPLDRIGLVLGPATMLAWFVWGPHELLTPEALRLSGIMLLTIVWWLTEPIPIAATGLLAVGLAVFLGAVPDDGTSSFQSARTALAPFGDPALFFLLGGMFLGRAMTVHGLDRRVALSILCTRWAGHSPATVLLAVGLSVGLVSMCISNTAATAMIYPVTMGIIAVLATGGDGRRPDQQAGFARSPYASALLLMTAYASSVGGIATPIGTTTNVVAMGFFRRPEFLGQSVDFLRWSIVGLPMMTAIFVGLFLWLRLQAPSARIDLPALREYLDAERRCLGAWNTGEKNTLVVFLAAVGLWLTPGVLAIVADKSTQDWVAVHLPEEIVALMIPVALFLLPVDWQQRRFSLSADDFAAIDWSTLLLFGAGLSLGSLMMKTGLTQVLGEVTLRTAGSEDVWVVTALAIAGGIVLSEFTSNAATASTLIPVVWSICQTAGVEPLPPLMGVTFGASFGSALPVSTPPNAIVYGSGLIPARRMIVAGMGLDLLCGIVIWCVLRAAFALGWSPVGNG